MQRPTRLAPTALAAIGLVLASTAALAPIGLTRAPAAFTIVFCSERDGDSDIYIMNDDGSGVRRITNSESNEFDTACSPDGLWVAFVSDRDGNPEVYVMRIDGTSVHRLTNHPALDVNPEWSPDGTRHRLRVRPRRRPGNLARESRTAAASGN